mmetsp:Transcript_30191/g.92341  ORF Transcript_30191/g.92341 Transcript_30191/m.92341 type:complete len:377 (+) Transcript_30191:26-1156(+)
MKPTQRLLVLALLAAAADAMALRVLEWVPSQQLLVTTAKFGWHQTWKTMMGELAPQSRDGDYLRPAPQTGTGAAPHLDDSGEYCLYVGNACPWCHRTALGLALRGNPRNVRLVELEDDATRASRGGWILKTGKDPVFGKPDLKQVYDAASREGRYEGRCTAPLLVDASSRRVVSQESGDILRALCELRANDVDLRPPHLASAIDLANEVVYEANDGVYRCGFATSQRAYDRAYANLHAALSRLNADLESTRFLVGDKLTEADLRLYPTVCRFDAVYASLFRCGASLGLAYPHLERWRRTMLGLPGIRDSFDAHAAAASYFTSLFPLNPSAIVPALPAHLRADEERSPSAPLLDILDAGLAFSFADRPDDAAPSSSS